MTEYKNKCPNGEHEFVPVIDMLLTGELNENGEEIEEEFQTNDCEVCEKEKYLRALRENDVNYFQEVINKEIERLQGRPQNTERKSINLITSFSPIIQKKSKAPLPHCEAAVKFLISGVLSKSVLMDDMGRVQSSLAFAWIDDSSVAKTPLTEVINLIAEEAFNIKDETGTIIEKRKKFEIVTNEGMKSALNKQFKENPNNVQEIYWIWDEVQEMSLMLKGQATGNLLILINEVINGKLKQKNTRGSGEDTAGKVHCPVWFTGVNRFFKIMANEESIWTDGTGLRIDFLPDADEDYIPPIKFKNAENVSEDLKVLIDALIYIRDIVRNITITDEAWEIYEKYRESVIRESRIKLPPGGFPSLTYYQGKAKAKYPERVLKYAQVWAAARGNIEGSVLTIDVEDMQNAIEDLEFYHKGSLNAFQKWLDFSRPQKKLEVIDRSQADLVDCYKNVWKLEKYRFTEVRDTNGNFNLQPDPNGTYVPRSNLLQYSHMTSNDFDNLMTTLVMNGTFEESKTMNRFNKPSGFKLLKL